MGEVVSRYGLAGLTLARVGRHSGLTASALVQRWGSKRALLLAFARRSAGGSAAVVRPEEGDVIPRLVAGLAAQAASMSTRTAIAGHLGFLQLDLTDPEFGEAARQRVRATRAEIRKGLEEARLRSELPAVDLDQLAATLLDVYNGALIGWALDPGGVSLQDHLVRRLRAAIPA